MTSPNETANPLPKTAPEAPRELPGVVLLQRVRCGKPTCRCASGQPDDLHGPYPYRFWRERGKLRKAYVRQSELETTQRACTARQHAERERRARSRALDALLSDFRRRSRDAERMLAAWRKTNA